MDYTMIWWDINGPWLNGIVMEYTMIEWDINGIYHDLMRY